MQLRPLLVLSVARPIFGFAVVHSRQGSVRMASFRNAEDDASLDFSDNPALTDDSFKAVLAGRASSLISISVAGCSELTNESIKP